MGPQRARARSTRVALRRSHLVEDGGAAALAAGLVLHQPAVLQREGGLQSAHRPPAHLPTSDGQLSRALLSEWSRESASEGSQTSGAERRTSEAKTLAGQIRNSLYAVRGGL